MTLDIPKDRSHMLTNDWFIQVPENEETVACLLHTTPAEFENGGFPLKTHQLFSIPTAPEEFKSAAITGYFVFVFEENSVEETTRLS